MTLTLGTPYVHHPALTPGRGVRETCGCGGVLEVVKRWLSDENEEKNQHRGERTLRRASLTHCVPRNHRTIILRRILRFLCNL